MPLENLLILKEKNQKRLRHLMNTAFILGVNLTPPSKFKNYLWIHSVYLLLTSGFVLYGHVEFMYRYRETLPVMLEGVCTFFQVLISFIKLAYMTAVRRRFYNLIRLVKTHELVNGFELLSDETPYNSELRESAIKILDTSWKFATFQFNFYMSACIMIITYYFSFAMGSNIYHAIVGTSNYTNALPISALYPFWEENLNKYPDFFLILILTISGMSIASTGALGFDGFFIHTSTHGAALIRILKKAIPFITSDQVPKSLRLDYLRQCIVQYEKTYQFCMELNDLYLQITLAQFLLSLLILGVVMFQALFGLETDYIMFVKMVFYISAAGYEVVIYCWNGQEIISESEGITNAWYECKWYNESKEFKQLIQMVMMRSNKTFVMRASWFSTMSLPTLISILRTSGSYFLLLRNVSEK